MPGRSIYIGSTSRELEGFCFELRYTFGNIEDVEWGRFLHDEATLEARIRAADLCLFFIGHQPDREQRVLREIQVAQAHGRAVVIIVIDGGDAWPAPEASDPAWRAYRKDRLAEYDHATVVRDAAGLAAATSAALSARGLIHEPVSAFFHRVTRSNTLPGPPTMAEGTVAAKPKRRAMASVDPAIDLTRVTDTLSTGAEEPRHRRRETLTFEESAAGADPLVSIDERHINIRFARRKRTIRATTTLARGETYAVRVDIGMSRADDTIVVDPSPFDRALLPRGGNWLDVGVTSASFETPERTQRIWLPETGDAWVCKCVKTHRCSPQERAPFLDLKVVAPKKAGLATLRLAVYFRNNVVQSHRIVVRVTSSEQQAPDAQASHADYTLTRDLSQVGVLEPRKLSILTNDDKGTHSIIVRGDDGKALRWDLTQPMVDTALRDVRYHLRSIHTDPNSKEGKGPNYLKPDGSKPQGSLSTDLRNLAWRGWNLYTALHAGAKGEGTTARFAEIAGEDAVPIHIARAGGTGLAYPFGLVYDIFLQSDRKKWKDCKLMTELHRFEDPKLTSCPYGPHEKNTICPFGFWGMRLDLEQPGATPLKDAKVHAPVGSALVIAAHEKLAKTMGDHENALKALAPRLTLDRRATLDDIEQAIGDADLAILYFYCHGAPAQLGSQDETMCLLVGKDETLSPGDVLGWFTQSPEASARQAHWADRQPLVFINGCHTVRATPETETNFVDTFGKFRAGGIVGTEVEVEQEFANKAAALILDAFRNGKTINESLRAMRHHFLARENALGLAYTAYAFSKLQLAEA